MDSHSYFSALTEPVHGDTVIWRYMSAQRLGELIQDRRLTLSSLLSMDDKKEGCLPEGQREAVSQELPFALPAFDDTASVQARWIFVSCWTEVIEESPEHWCAYGSNGSEVAIASTVGRLRKATIDARQCQYLISRVKYVSQTENYLLSDNNGGGLVGPALWKRKEEFEWEREIRLVAVVQQPDYIFYGPIFEKQIQQTPTAAPVTGLCLAALAPAARAADEIPIIAIGGVTRAYEWDCIRAGAGGIASIRMFV